MPASANVRQTPSSKPSWRLLLGKRGALLRWTSIRQDVGGLLRSAVSLRYYLEPEPELVKGGVAIGTCFFEIQLFT